MKIEDFTFFSALDDSAKSYLLEHIKFVKIPKDTLLFYQGDVCDKILLLSQGEVSLYTQEKSIESLTLYTLKSGEQCIVNTASLLSKTPAVASAQSITDISGYVIYADDVKRLAKMS